MAKPGTFKRRRNLGELEGTQEAQDLAKKQGRRFTSYSDKVEDLHDMIDFNVEKGPRVRGERDYGHRSVIPKLTAEEESHPLIKQIREEAKSASAKRASADADLMAKTEAGEASSSKASLEDDFEKSVEKKKAAQRAALQVEEDAVYARRHSHFARVIKDGIEPEPTKEPEIMAKKTTTTPPPNKDLQEILKKAAAPSSEKKGTVAYVRKDFKPPTAAEISESVNKPKTNKSVGSAKYTGPSNSMKTGVTDYPDKKAFREKQVFNSLVEKSPEAPQDMKEYFKAVTKDIREGRNAPLAEYTGPASEKDTRKFKDPDLAKHVRPSHPFEGYAKPITDSDAAKARVRKLASMVRTNDTGESSREFAATSDIKAQGKMVRDTGTKTLPDQKGEIQLAKNNIKTTYRGAEGWQRMALADHPDFEKTRAAGGFEPPKAKDLMASVEGSKKSFKGEIQPSKQAKADLSIANPKAVKPTTLRAGKPWFPTKATAESAAYVDREPKAADVHIGRPSAIRAEGGIVTKAVNAVNEAAGTAARTAGQTLTKFRPEWMAKTGKTVKDIAMPAIEKAASSGAGRLAGKVAARLTPVGAAVGLAADAYAVGKAGVEGVKAVNVASEQARNKAASEAKYGTKQRAIETRWARKGIQAPATASPGKDLSSGFKAAGISDSPTPRRSEGVAFSDLPKSSPEPKSRSFSDLPKSSTPTVAKAKNVIKGLTGDRPDVSDKSIKTSTLAKNKEYIARLKKEADEYRLKKFQD